MAANVVREAGGHVTLAHNIARAREIVATKTFDLVLLDNHLPDGKGYDFFNQAARRNPDAPIVMITGVPDLGEAVSLTRNGLFEYLTKPISVDALTACLDRAKMRLATRNTPAEATEICGDSPAMREVLAQLRQAAKHAASTVLLTCETGAGKDLAARVLHQLSFPDGRAPFIAVNCAALPGEMFESELFGAERGAFTGADKKRGGLVAAAASGTLKAGRFREDLLYRFDVFSVELPPLRKRRADIPGLAERLLGHLAQKYDRAKPLLTPEDAAKLSAHDFPGNVRELRNVLERSLLKTADDAKWLALDVNWLNRGSSASAPVAGAVPTAAETLPADRSLSPIEAQEYRLIRDTLIEANGGIRRAATKLGMSPQALLRRLEKWPELRVEKN